MYLIEYTQNYFEKYLFNDIFTTYNYRPEVSGDLNFKEWLVDSNKGMLQTASGTGCLSYMYLFCFYDITRAKIEQWLAILRSF